MGRFFVVSVGSSSDTGKIKIPVWGFVFLVALVGLCMPTFAVALWVPFAPYGSNVARKGACFHQLSARTVGSSSDTGKNKNPRLGICIFGGPGRTRTDTPRRT